MSLKRIAIRTAPLGLLLLCAVTAIAAQGKPQRENGPSSPLPGPLLTPLPPELQLPAAPPPPAAPSAKSPEAIGTAEMEPNGTIRLHLWPPAEPTSDETFHPGVPWGFSQERIGYGEIEIQWTDAAYEHVLKHLGGLHPGEVKPVPPWRADEHWHCLVDPDRGPCPLEHLLQ
jgi:hypothetical protein